MASFHFNGQPIDAEDGDTVLGALLRAGVKLDNGCRVGACQACLVCTKEAVPASAQAGLDDDLVERGAFLACQAKAGSVTDLVSLGEDVRQRYAAQVVGRRMATDDILILRLSVPGWNARPGRFVRLSDATGTSRPYSIATPAWSAAESLELHIRVIDGGLMSPALASGASGDSLTVEGPYGRCVYRSDSGTEPLLLLGSGTGFAPLYGIATDAVHRGHRAPIHLFHAIRSATDSYFADEMQELIRANPNVNYIPIVTEGMDLEARKTAPLDQALRLLPELDGYRVYLCGAPDLVRVAQRKCFLAGADLKHIAADAFAAA